MFPSWHFFDLVDAGLPFSVKGDTFKFMIATVGGRVRLAVGEESVVGDAEEILASLNSLLLQTQNSFTTLPSFECDGPLFLDPGSFVEFSIHVEPVKISGRARKVATHYEVAILAADELLHAARHAVVEVRTKGAEPVLLEMKLLDNNTFVELGRFSKAAPPQRAHALVVAGARWTGATPPDVLYDQLYGPGASRTVQEAADAEHALAEIELSRIQEGLRKPGAPLDHRTHEESVRRLIAEVRAAS